LVQRVVGPARRAGPPGPPRQGGPTRPTDRNTALATTSWTVSWPRLRWPCGCAPGWPPVRWHHPGPPLRLGRRRRLHPGTDLLYPVPIPRERKKKPPAGAAG